MPITFVVFGISLLIVLLTNIVEFKSKAIKLVVCLFLIITLIGYLNFNYIHNLDYSINSIHLVSFIILLVSGVINFKFNAVNINLVIIELLIFMIICNSMAFNISTLLAMYSFINVLFVIFYYAINGLRGLYSYMVVSVNMIYILILRLEYYELDFVLIDFNNLFYNLILGSLVVVLLWSESKYKLNVWSVCSEKKIFNSVATNGLCSDVKYCKYSGFCRR